ncbi:hypothetical protein ACTXGQ_04390 [Marinobacter sp. 1Y8]
MSIVTEVQKLMALALQMTAEERLQVHVSYAPHCQSISVNATPFNQEWREGIEINHMVRDNIYLDLIGPERAIHWLQSIRQRIEEVAPPVAEKLEAGGK